MFRRENVDAARRFITLIDEIYRHQTKLIMGAEVPQAQLFADFAPLKVCSFDIISFPITTLVILLA